MKGFKLSIIATIAMLSSNVFATANLEGGIKRLVYVKDNSGNWTVSGYPNGYVYANEMDKYYSKIYQNKALEISDAGYPDDVESKKFSDNAYELWALREKAKRDGQEADYVLENLKKGYSLSDSKRLASNKMIREGFEPTFKDTFNPEEPETSYNANSVTSSMIAGNSTSTESNPSKFKQFNELDCSYEEVSNYLDKSKSPKTKAFSTSPSFSGTFKETATKSATKLKSEEDAACQTIFHDINFNQLDDLSISSIASGLPSFDSFGNMMDDLGNKAGEQLNGLVSDLYGKLREGFCSRLSPEYVGGLAGDLVDDAYNKVNKKANDAYKDKTKGTALEGTKMNALDTKAGRNSFTYKVIKNQTELSDSNLIKALDVTRDDQDTYQKKYLKKEFDDILDNLEEDIFG